MVNPYSFQLQERHFPLECDGDYRIDDRERRTFTGSIKEKPAVLFSA